MQEISTRHKNTKAHASASRKRLRSVVCALSAFSHCADFSGRFLLCLKARLHLSILICAPCYVRATLCQEECCYKSLTSLHTSLSDPVFTNYCGGKLVAFGVALIYTASKVAAWSILHPFLPTELHYLLRSFTNSQPDVKCHSLPQPTSHLLDSQILNSGQIDLTFSASPLSSFARWFCGSAL